LQVERGGIPNPESGGTSSRTAEKRKSLNATAIADREQVAAVDIARF
jgi:hypothetical protein